MFSGLTLLLASASPAAAAGQTPDPPVSLIVGSWRGESQVVGVPCPEDMICTNVIGNVRLGEVRTLAGPSVAKQVTARFEFHAPLVAGADLILLVRPAPGRWGGLQGRPVSVVRRGRSVCVPITLFAANAIAIPAGAARGKEGVCFAPGEKPPRRKPENTGVEWKQG